MTLFSRKPKYKTLVEEDQGFKPDRCETMIYSNTSSNTSH